MKLLYRVKYTYRVRGGDARWFCVRINPKYRDDAGLHAHEYEHVKQWYACLTVGLLAALAMYVAGFAAAAFFVAVAIAPNLKGLLYMLRPARQWMEVQAYKRQIPHYDWDATEYFANRLMLDYRLNLTQARALELLRKWQ